MTLLALLRDIYSVNWQHRKKEDWQHQGEDLHCMACFPNCALKPCWTSKLLQRSIVEAREENFIVCRTTHAGAKHPRQVGTVMEVT